MKLTEPQRIALASIIVRYDAFVARELARWGKESADRVAASGIEITDVPQRTLHALVDRGLLVMSSREGYYKKDRRGAYGRRIGGTKSGTFINLFFVPTSIGRSVVERGRASKAVV